MTTSAEVESAIREARQDWAKRRRTIEALRDASGLTVQQLATRMDMKRSTVDSHLKGKVTMPYEELAGYAAALGVPVKVLEMSPMDAVRWVMDNQPDLLKIRRFSTSPQRAA
jgi:DNA-binding transcriptional ArsR family regulator